MVSPQRTARGGPWVGLPWLLIIAVAAFELSHDIADMRDLRTGSLLSPAPALAAIRGTPRAVTAVTAAAALVGVVIAVADTSGEFVYHLTIIGAVFVVGLTSLLASTARERREARLSQVLRVSETVQLALLPPVPRRAGELRLEARYVAAELEARVGGDLYEAVVLRDHVRLIIGDVRGKGMPAVRTAAAVLGAFREAAHHELTLPRVAVRCSEAVARLERDGGHVFAGTAEEADELFVTAAVVEIEGPQLRLVNLGHPPPLLLTPRAVHYVGGDGDDSMPPLGLAHQLYDDFPVLQRRWQPGERLLLYTDGIQEARDPNGQFFPLDRVMDTLLQTPTEDLPDRLLWAVDRYTGRRMQDDAALLAVEWCCPEDGD